MTVYVCEVGGVETGGCVSLVTASRRAALEHCLTMVMKSNLHWLACVKKNEAFDAAHGRYMNETNKKSVKMWHNDFNFVSMTK